MTMRSLLHLIPNNTLPIECTLVLKGVELQQSGGISAGCETKSPKLLLLLTPHATGSALA
ncbi:hypothetical protein SESBI_05538 [Sesbania bispinosa]|nr:hypothetical protein SESBI_05538 [Sesbania bispinosa]